ncbi:MAG TPA: HAMP domain-containing protein [Clostridiales bacterium]|jgi:signal transduction histidine kinase|nr:HAMP domain-containing protein [Clostridiales bacterium]
MKHSIRFKLALLLTALIAFTIFITWFINRTFLADYYLHCKVDQIADVFYRVKDIYADYKDELFLSEEDTLTMERLSSNSNVNIYVFMSFAGAPLSSFPHPLDFGEREEAQVNLLIRNYMSDNTDEINREVIKKEDNYIIYRLYDSHLDSNYIDLIGVLDEKIVFLRSNFESIQESVALANRFLSYIGLAAVIIGIIAMLLVSSKFTKPIHEMANIAKKMSELDFEVKYPVKNKDEIGELGNSLNILSDKLQSTISELKSANNELQLDIQKKTEIDEMRKEFLSNVSHELKTPISLIQGYAEGLIENVNEDEENRNFYCEVIIDEANKMNQMVKKLLTLNELEFGSNQVNFERFDIVQLIKSVLMTNGILFKQKEVTVHFNENEPIYVWADEYLIQQVVSNYISNALNHVSGANIIEIKLVRRGNVLRVAVFNTGENIPEEELDKLWIKFYKVDKSRTREYGGNGIGLSIVKAIMNSHNKECGVINHSVGVEFWFEVDITSL